MNVWIVHFMSEMRDLQGILTLQFSCLTYEIDELWRLFDYKLVPISILADFWVFLIYTGLLFSWCLDEIYESEER